MTSDDMISNRHHNQAPEEVVEDRSQQQEEEEWTTTQTGEYTFIEAKNPSSLNTSGGSNAAIIRRKEINRFRVSSLQIKIKRVIRVLTMMIIPKKTSN